MDIVWNSLCYFYYIVLLAIYPKLIELALDAVYRVFSYLPVTFHVSLKFFKVKNVLSVSLNPHAETFWPLKIISHLCILTFLIYLLPYKGVMESTFIFWFCGFIFRHNNDTVCRMDSQTKHFQEAAALMIWKGMTVSKPLHLSSVPVEATSISNWLSLNTF